MNAAWRDNWCTEHRGPLSRDSPYLESASRLPPAPQPAVCQHLEFSVRPAVGARPETAAVSAASQPASQPAPRSPEVLRPRRSHAPSPVPAACRGPCGLRAQGPGGPTAASAAAPSCLASRRVPAVEGDGEGGDTGSWRQTQLLGAQLRLETDGGRGGGTLPPPATGGGTPPSAAAAPSPRCTPARRLRAGPAEQAGESSWHCPPRAPPRPAGDLLRAGEEPPPPPPDRLQAPGKVKGGRGARGRPVRSLALKETRRAALRSPQTHCAHPAAAARHPGRTARPGKLHRGRSPASTREGRPQVSADLRWL